MKTNIQLIELVREGMENYLEYKFQFQVFTNKVRQGYIHILNGELQTVVCDCEHMMWEKSRSIPTNRPCKHIKYIIDLLTYLDYLSNEPEQEPLSKE